ncbi:hypothetical protein [Halobiforma nitratireducens]|uniref:hypothetical protein n=1 Tax=Halobiforma nitratireducens TaxID=130048 RepID=UPI00135F15BB|nr:hypothetical protein [Halobiforma nitratireducens]
MSRGEGTIPERIVDASAGTVLLARGKQRSPRTLRQAIVQRLERKPAEKTYRLQGDE